jgi:hypothetical protein
VALGTVPPNRMKVLEALLTGGQRNPRQPQLPHQAVAASLRERIAER